MVKKHINPNEEEEGSGTGGRSGDIQFRDFLNPGALRDDLLPPDEKKRILSAHREGHEARVQKQKEKREQYKAVKEGKTPVSALRESLGSGMNSAYRAHPLLSDKAQFSGVDAQINPNPADHLADTNANDRDELENQYRLRHAPQITPKFNPKPQFNK